MGCTCDINWDCTDDDPCPEPGAATRGGGDVTEIGLYLTGGAGRRRRLLLRIARLLGMRGATAFEVIDHGDVIVLTRLGSGLTSERLEALEAIAAEPPAVRAALLDAEVLRARGHLGEPDPALPCLTPEQAAAARRGEDVEP